jgi:hypothetical protein
MKENGQRSLASTRCTCGLGARERDVALLTDDALEEGADAHAGSGGFMPPEQLRRGPEPSGGPPTRAHSAGSHSSASRLLGG